jgi:hypothetical protein
MTPQEKLKEIKEYMEINPGGMDRNHGLFLIARVEQLEAALRKFDYGHQKTLVRATLETGPKPE